MPGVGITQWMVTLTLHAMEVLGLTPRSSLHPTHYKPGHIPDPKQRTKTSGPSFPGAGQYLRQNQLNSPLDGQSHEQHRTAS